MNKDTVGFTTIAWMNDTDWISPPSQKRSRHTLQKVLTTARDLFITGGFEETTIAEISRQSGVSVGSIYNLFPDKHSIFRGLYEHYRSVREAQIHEMVEQPHWQTAAALDVIRFHIDIVLVPPARMPVFYVWWSNAAARIWGSTRFWPELKKASVN